jgi:cobalt-zinc-cadmium efflux system outer membrane protein
MVPVLVGSTRIRIRKEESASVFMKVPRRALAQSLALILALGLARHGAEAREPDGEFTLPARLRLSDALRLFRQQGLDLILAEAAVEAARGDTLLASAAPNPTFSGGIGRSFACSTAAGVDCSALAWNFGISDGAAIFDSVSGKRGLRMSAANLALEVARKGEADARRTLEGLLRQTYLNAVAARQALTTQKEAQATLAHLADLIRARYQSGSISEVEVLKIETEKLAADQEVERAQRDLAVAKSDLAFMMGVRGRVPVFEVDAALPGYVVPQALAGATVDSLLEVARKNRPDLAGAKANRDRAQASLRSSQRLRFPDIELSAGVSGQGSYASAINPPTFAIGLSLTPPIFNRFQGEIVKSKADLTAQQAQLAKTEAQVLSDVQTAFTQFTSARSRVERAERELLEHASRTRDLVQIQYQKGAASLLEYLDAQRILISTKLDYESDLSDYWLAVVLIGQAVGLEMNP